MEANDMRAWILIGSLTAAVGAAACGTQVAQPLEANGAIVTPVAAPERIVYQDAVYERVPVARPVARPAVVRTEAPAPMAAAPTTEIVAERKPSRTWQKRAMVIGGSSGAGAGLGALIGGKKGALIGAAIGGGAGTVYEMQK
jgi:hypothetical protein